PRSPPFPYTTLFRSRREGRRRREPRRLLCLKKHNSGRARRGTLGGTEERAMAGILHATDFSAASGAAFTWAVNMARRDRAELLLLHVLSPPAPLVADAYVTPAVWNTLIRSQRASAQRRLDALVAKARRARVRA